MGHIRMLVAGALLRVAEFGLDASAATGGATAAVQPRGQVRLRETPDGVTQAEMLADYGFAQVAAWGALGETARADAWQTWANEQWLASPAWRERAERIKARASA